MRRPLIPLVLATAAALAPAASAQEAAHGLSAVETSAGVVAIPAGAAQRLQDAPAGGGVSWSTAELTGLLSWAVGDPEMSTRAGLEPLGDLIRQAFPGDRLEPIRWVEIDGQLAAVFDIERPGERIRTLAWYCPASGQRVTQTLSGSPQAVDLGSEGVAAISRCPAARRLPTVFLDRRPEGWQTVRGTSGASVIYRREDSRGTLTLTPAPAQTGGSCEERFQALAGALAGAGLTVNPPLSEPLGEGCRWSGTLTGPTRTVHYRYELQPCPGQGAGGDWYSALTRHTPDLSASEFVDLAGAVSCTYQAGPGGP